MYSILSRRLDEEAYKSKIEALSMPEYMVDLNIDQIIKLIVKDWDPELDKLYYWVPDNKEDEDFRRDIFRDVKNAKIYTKLKNYLDVVKKREDCLAKKEQVEKKAQKYVWHVREVIAYAEAVEYLIDILDEPEITSEGLKGLKEYLIEYISTPEYVALRTEAASLAKTLKDFRFLITYENGKIVITEGQGSGSYTDFLNNGFPNNGKTFMSPFMASPELSDLENEVVDVVIRNHREFFGRAADFCSEHKKYLRENVLYLSREFAYYMAYADFINKLEDKGLTFCRPEISGDKLSAADMYDLALACVNLKDGKTVVANDFELLPEEKFIVLTGPNQGGKTTFARSLGQVIYFTKMGLDVPAMSANVPYYTQIMSHFSVEESVETGKGKLMEELSRLKPMMGDDRDGAFVVINELFTTAANYDANIMGKRVLEHFIDHKCKGIYVTHLNELATAHKNVVSFRATTDENNQQTFKVIRDAAQEIVGAGMQVEKYGLTYEQIRGRFS